MQDVSFTLLGGNRWLCRVGDCGSDFDDFAGGREVAFVEPKIRQHAASRLHVIRDVVAYVALAIPIA